MPTQTVIVFTCWTKKQAAQVRAKVDVQSYPEYTEWKPEWARRLDYTFLDGLANIEGIDHFREGEAIAFRLDGVNDQSLIEEEERLFVYLRRMGSGANYSLDLYQGWGVNRFEIEEFGCDILCDMIELVDGKVGKTLYSNSDTPFPLFSQGEACVHG